MFPIPDAALKLREIATHWSSELEGRLSKEQVLDRLLDAFWSGELICSLPGPNADIDLRARVLRTIGRDHTHPGLLVVTNDAPRPPAITQAVDDVYEVDLRTVIAVPEDEDALGRTRAYDALRTVSLDSYSGAVAPMLQMMSVSQGDFETYCLDHGFELPAFWFPKRKSSQTAASVSQCRRWFIDMASRCRRPPRKQDVVGQMKTKFEVSERAALGIWEKHAPESWKAPGPKSPRRR